MRQDSNWLAWVVLAVAVFALTVAVGQVWPGHPETGTVQADEGDWPEWELELQELDAHRITWLTDQAVELERRSRRAAQVNVYLAGSPMAGLGDVMVAHADRTGVSVYLCPAIAQAESSKGRRTCGSFNGWGMRGCSFSSWDHGVAAFFDNVVGNTWWAPYQTAYDLQQEPYPYCVLDDRVTVNPEWGPNVQGQVEYIEGIIP